MNSSRLRKLEANQTSAKNIVGRNRLHTQHVHNWTGWKIKVKNPSKWVDAPTPYSPGGFWIDRWWERQCIRGNKVKHIDKRGMPPLPPNPPYYPFENTETRVFVQGSGISYVNG
jgi:hypothetical protein